MENGLELVEVVPGIDPAKDILCQMGIPIAVPPRIPSMDPILFREG
jgi:acyl CoA:acetate/3-ketoacid CoA transferase